MARATTSSTRESAALFRRFRATRDPALRDQIVTRHLPLARSLARSFDSSRVPHDDLFQIASIGLIKAVDRYDAAFGTTFSTFAVPTIRGEILRYFRDFTWGVRPPRNLQERALALVRATDEMRGQLGRAPSAAELAERVGVSVEDVLEGLYAAEARDGDPIERSADDAEEPSPRRDTFGADDAEYDRVDDAVSAELLMTQLTALERHVLRLRFHEDLTQEEVAQDVGCSQMQISRIQRGAMAKLTRIAQDGGDGRAFDAERGRHGMLRRDDLQAA